MDLDGVFRTIGEFVARRIGEETVLVPVRGAKADLDAVYTLNAVGSLIWQRLDGRTPLGAIVQEVCSAFEIDHATALNDVLAFITDLERAGLVEPVPA